MTPDKVREAIKVVNNFMDLKIYEIGDFDMMKDNVKILLDLAQSVLDAKMPEFHPTKGGYTEFEKYTNCEHKKKDELVSDCMECDIAWLIERCRVLEKALSDFRLWQTKCLGKLAGYLRATRDKDGNDPFIRYQEAMCSKGFLLDIIVEEIRNLFGGGE